MAVKRKKEVSWRHRFWFAFLRVVLTPFIKLKYHYKAPKYKLKKKQPFLILSNHTIHIDSLILASSFNFPIYFVATEQIFNLGFTSKLLKHLVNPIAKTKSLSDIGTIKKIKRIVDQGGSVGIAPEGNVSYTGETCQIPFAIAKLIKFLHIPVIFWNAEGFYIRQPRWAVTPNKAKTKGYIRSILDPSEYENYSEEQIYEIVCDQLYVNAYQNEGITFKGKKRAEGLERLLFMCPKCHQVKTLETKNATIHCKNCGYQAEYLTNGMLRDSNQNENTTIELEYQQRKNYLKYLTEKHHELFFKEDAQLEESFATYKKKRGKIQFAMNAKGVTLFGKNINKHFSYSELTALAIQGRHKIILYTRNEGTFLVCFDDKVSPYLYLLTYQYFKLYEERGENYDVFNDISKFGL